MNQDQTAADLKALQDQIYRENVLRAREMTAEQRFAEAIELTNEVFVRMHEGAMWQIGTTDSERGWEEVRRRLTRLCRVHEEGRFADARPINLS